MYERELQLAILAVKKSEKTFRKYFGTRTKIEIKGGNYRDLVSYADKKIESDIKQFLAKQFPKYGFIGEEHGIKNGNAVYSWVLDPIDGTSNYLQGLADSCISLALLKNKTSVLGVVYAPILNLLYTGALGKQSHLNGKRIKVSEIRDVKMAFGALGWGRDIDFAKKHFPKLLPQIFKMRTVGSAALAICQVASGNYDFIVRNTSGIWDHSAAQIILEEAGGAFFQLKKQFLQIAANKVLAKKLTALLSS